MKQLTQDSQDLERVRRESIQMDGAQYSPYELAVAQMSYSDRMKKVKAAYDECSTPEQFMRAQNNS